MGPRSPWEARCACGIAPAWRRTELGRSTSVCEPSDVVFGESLSAAASSEPAEWIRESFGGEPWSFGALVPNRYESLLRLHAPDPTPDDWWELYRELFVLVASLGVSYTTTSTQAWFAIWDGHGFDKTTHLAWQDPPANDAERQWRSAERERQGIADRERQATIGAALAALPRFDLPRERAVMCVMGGFG